MPPHREPVNEQIHPFHGLVLLIGGSSGTGKSTLARQLGQAWSIPALQVDDFRLVLQSVTNPKPMPWACCGRHWDW